MRNREWGSGGVWSRTYRVGSRKKEEKDEGKDKKEIFGDKIEYKPKTRNVYIQSNEDLKVGVGIHVPKIATSGTYIFNVDVRSQDGSPYTNVQKFYVNVP